LKIAPSPSSLLSTTEDLKTKTSLMSNPPLEEADQVEDQAEEEVEEEEEEVSPEEEEDQTVLEVVDLATTTILLTLNTKEEQDRHQLLLEHPANHVPKTLFMSLTFHSISMTMISNKSSANST